MVEVRKKEEGRGKKPKIIPFLESNKRLNFKSKVTHSKVKSKTEQAFHQLILIINKLLIYLATFDNWDQVYFDKKSYFVVRINK
jgi:hypothetical protein